jgi:hypothetical protein
MKEPKKSQRNSTPALTESRARTTSLQLLLPLFSALTPAIANAAVTPSIADASTFPSAPNFQTFAPSTTATGVERSVLTLSSGAGDPRIITQSFRLGSPVTIGSIHLLYVRGVSGELFKVQIFPVTNTLAAQGATAGLLTDYNNAVANGFLLNATVTMPTTLNDATERMLTLTLTGADAITLPATTGNAGYGIAFTSV